jgi:SAM-dependent methyltransferase
VPTKEVAADFDRISSVYDETRDPLETATVQGVARTFRAAGVDSLLEVGVGTGRVARPLLGQGLTVTGIDASWGMLAQARQKGIERLVHGSAYRLPFRDGAFDAVLFVHVLHLLDDAPAALREASRASRVATYALVHPRAHRDPDAPGHEDTPRRILREVLVEQGFEIPNRSGPWGQERVLLERSPPDRLDVLSDREVTERLQSEVDRLAKRGHRYLLKVPPDALARAIQVTRERVGDRTMTYRRVEALARWDAGRAPATAPV